MKHPVVPLLLAFASLAFFPLGIYVLETERAFGPLMMLATPALLLALLASVLGFRRWGQKPKGGAYGFAVSGSLVALFACVFWLVMVPMLSLFALPARELDVEDPILAESEQNMRILVRQIKSFHRESGRLPVKMEELVDTGYVAARILYDPRDPLKTVVSYRLMVQELPPEDQWDAIPFLEGRWPDAEGFRLVAYASERMDRIRP